MQMINRFSVPYRSVYETVYNPFEQFIGFDIN